MTRTILHAERAAGSIDGAGWRFQSFEINDLELVDQNSASWNQIFDWLSRLEGLRRVA
jgi:hypothetical protein